MISDSCLQSGMAAHPLGYIEYREALAANAPYGKWLRSKPIAAQIGGTIFMHGGINLEFTTESIDNLNKRVRRELKEFDDGFRWLQQHDVAAPFSNLSEVVRAAENEWVKLDAKRKGDSLTDEDITQALQGVCDLALKELADVESLTVTEATVNQDRVDAKIVIQLPDGIETEVEVNGIGI